MGACSFFNMIESASADDGFRELCKNAIQECGNDPYNGTISTTNLVSRTIKIADKYSAKAMGKGKKYAETHIEDIPKRRCQALDLGVVRYEVHTLKKVPGANNEYELIGFDFDKSDRYGYFKTKEEAVAKAEKLFMHEPYSNYRIIQTKAAYKTMVKTYKSKPSRVPKDGRLVEIHRYLYFGVAAE